MIPYSQIAEWEVNGQSHKFSLMVVESDLKNTVDELKGIYKIEIEDTELYSFEKVFMVTLIGKKMFLAL